MHGPRCDQTPAWAALRAHFDAHGRAFDLREAFARDTQRFERFSQPAPHVFADLSRNLLDDTTQAFLLQLAHERGVMAQRDALFAGEPVNRTEQRAALHTLLRADQPPAGVDAPLWAEVQAAREAMLVYADHVRADAAITDVVSIGIGGSDLGPQMAVQALESAVLPAKRFHFVSNVDGHELAAVLRQVRPASTLFVVVSKTFTTLETLTNANSARRWFEAEGGTDIGRHFVAVTAQPDNAHAFGIAHCFGFRDWVGGRYSLWSAVGLPLAIAIGAQGFRELLAGARAMDAHFMEAPAAANLPLRLGLLDVWYRNFHGFASRSIAPYHSGLRRLPAYLQQLEMESNGKRVALDGGTLPFDTAPVLWGEPGTNGQHAYFQMLHQGTQRVPVEFVLVRRAAHQLEGHHQLLLASALAQARALMLGRNSDDPHRHFPGNRPSTTLLLQALTPASLGALLALQEHRVFVSGAVWGINSFDQWGVELGKAITQDIAPRLLSGDTAGLDGATAGLLQQLAQDGAQR